MKKIIIAFGLFALALLTFWAVVEKDLIQDFFSEDILLKPDKIQIISPKINEPVFSPLQITGLARGYWYFEASFPIQLLNARGEVIATAIAQAQSDWMTEDFVLFEATLEFAGTPGEKGILVFKKDNPSGLPEYDAAVKIPVVFQETTEIKAYFNNSDLDPEFSCNKVFSVERTVPKTQAVARAALEELLQGPTALEESQGFFTNLNPGVKIQKLAIVGGIAKVDFNEQLEFQVGGSCRVAAIRAQIEETLKQFPTVQEVIISINGRIEDILQP